MLSILYLRCREYARNGAVAVLGVAFNSLFEMPARSVCEKITRRKKLSILYLRCMAVKKRLAVVDVERFVLSILYLRCIRLVKRGVLEKKMVFQFSI